MKGKWKDTRGETLVEVLASILIGSLSVTLLFSAVMASGSMDKTARAADKVLSDNLNEAEGQNGSVSPNKVTVSDPNSPLPDREISVNFYGGEGTWSFALPTPP